jgi:hypothetical protein
MRYYIIGTAWLCLAGAFGAIRPLKGQKVHYIASHRRKPAASSGGTGIACGELNTITRSYCSGSGIPLVRVEWGLQFRSADLGMKHRTGARRVIRIDVGGAKCSRLAGIEIARQYRVSFGKAEARQYRVSSEQAGSLPISRRKIRENKQLTAYFQSGVRAVSPAVRIGTCVPGRKKLGPLRNRGAQLRRPSLSELYLFDTIRGARALEGATATHGSSQATVNPNESPPAHL